MFKVTVCLMLIQIIIMAFNCRIESILLKLKNSLLLFYLFLPSMGWLCGVGVFGLIKYSHSLPALHSGLQNDNSNCINVGPNDLLINRLSAATFSCLSLNISSL